MVESQAAPGKSRREEVLKQTSNIGIHFDLQPRPAFFFIKQPGFGSELHNMSPNTVWSK